MKTAAFVVDRLKRVGISDIQTKVGQSGVSALLRGDSPGRVLGLRADMDALPVTEGTGLPFASIWTEAHPGEIGYGEGVLMASADFFSMRPRFMALT